MKLTPKEKNEESGDRRTRAETKLGGLMKKEPAVRKIVRKAAVLADLITEEDLEDDARVIREATTATLHVYDPDEKKLVEKPDHKTRLAAVTLRRAYHEGTPIKRQVTLTGSFEDAATIIDRIGDSPAGQEAIRKLSGLGLNIAIEGETIEAEIVQKSGSEIESEATE